MSSRTGHVTTETVYGQTLALRLGNGNEHCALESDTMGLNVKGNLYLTTHIKQTVTLPRKHFATCLGVMTPQVEKHCCTPTVCHCYRTEVQERVFKLPWQCEQSLCVKLAFVIPLVRDRNFLFLLISLWSSAYYNIYSIHLLLISISE